MTNQQLYLAIGIPVLVYLFGFTVTIFMMWSTSKRIDDLGVSLNKRIDDLRDSLRAEIAGLRDYIHSEVKRLEERIERAEHPIVRNK